MYKSYIATLPANGNGNGNSNGALPLAHKRTVHVHRASKRKSDMNSVSVASATATASELHTNNASCVCACADEPEERQCSSTESLPRPHEPDAIYLCSKRLKRLLKQLASNEPVNRQEMVYNVSYASDVLSAVLEENTRRLNEEDNDMNELHSQANTVPDQVRDWLASTFTRSMSTVKAPLRDRFKFKSVVQAVRAGITVERLYGRMSSLPFSLSTEIQSFLSENVDMWTMDVMRLNELTGEHSLKIIGYQLLHRYDVIKKQKISVSTLEAFLSELEAGYSKYGNPYHNLMHAADVTQTVHYLISRSQIVNWLSDLEIFAVLIAALIHDVAHTGTTNSFHINSDSELALMYNDRSVLENHHLATSFSLLHSEGCNIVKGLKREDYRTFRSNVVEMVLATDMSFHFQQLKTMKSLLTSPEHIDKQRALAFVLHSADISHPAKGWDVHQKWTTLLLEEFFRQGDREKQLNLPFSPLCDRATTLVPESQIGFIDFIVSPTFAILGDIIDKVNNQELNSSSASASASASPFGLQNEVIDEAAEDRDKDRDRDNGLSPAASPAKSPRPPFVLDRVWEPHLARNRATWLEKSRESASNNSEKPAPPSHT